jgi:hypothetical protein
MRAVSTGTYRIGGRPSPFAKHGGLDIMVVADASISASRKS